jgi:hypothetical protein
LGWLRRLVGVAALELVAGMKGDWGSEALGNTLPLSFAMMEEYGQEAIQVR